MSLRTLQGVRGEVGRARARSNADLVVESCGSACRPEAAKYYEAYGAYLQELGRRREVYAGGVSGRGKLGQLPGSVVPPVWTGGGVRDVRRLDMDGTVGNGSCGLPCVSDAYASGSSPRLSQAQGVGLLGQTHVTVEGLGSEGEGSKGDRSKVESDGFGEAPRVLRSVAAVTGEECGTSDVSRGKHYVKNRRKRLAKREAMQRQWRKVDGSGGCVSDSSIAGTVMTVDSRTAEEIEAAKTLALRRVAENKVAVKLAEHKLRKLEDGTRTDVIERLAAARYEEQINGAKLRSQTSFKKCDDALKSLGSTGSAGEFALKQQIKDAQQSEAMLKYVQDQCDYYQKFASEEVRTHVRCMRPPKIIDAFEVFGDCPSEYDEDEATAYYADLQRQNDEAHEKFADWGQNDTLF